MISCPRVVVGATSSGTGKTSVSLGIIAALRQRGLEVQTFKTGPDFLDPSYLAIVSGRPCYNLDGWMMGREYIERLVAKACADADIAVIEGAMGLFDGSRPDSIEGSAAEIAVWLEAPVLLVVNAHGMARSIAALVKGFAGLEPSVNVAGVIANWCGSESHGAYLEESLVSALLPPIVGRIPRGGLPELSSRHLGLVTADAKTLPATTIEKLAYVMKRHSSLDAILDIARKAPVLNVKYSAAKSVNERVCLGIAHDDAFHFYYDDFLEELAARGCALVRFSPATDKSIPEGVDALYFGGGYPEELAGMLSENEPMRRSVHNFFVSGRTIYAECGGLMYLATSLEGADGKTYPMTGILPSKVKMYRRRQSLAYVEVTLRENALWGIKGDTARGHEFHYSRLTSDPAGREGWGCVYSMKKRRSVSVSEGYRRGRVLASYAHLHLASQEKAIEHFINQCKGDK